MPVVPLTNGTGIVEAVCLYSLYTRCAALFDPGGAFEDAPYVPEWPAAPTAFAGASIPLSLIPTDSRWSARASNSDSMPWQAPFIHVQSGQPDSVEKLDGASEYVTVPIVALYRARRDDSDGIAAGRATLRPKAEMAALAMQYVLQRLMVEDAVALDPTNRFGIMHAEADGIAVAGEAASSADEQLDGSQRNVDYCDAAVRILVYQHRRDDQGTT